MPYNYATERGKLFTENGVHILLHVRDKALRLIKQAGCVRSGELLYGDTWTALAAIDYMVERGELRELTGPDVAGQSRVFVAIEGGA